MPEKGYYHPSRGYWQTISVPTPAQIAAFPEGTIEVPLKPAPDKIWNGSAWVADPNYAIAPELVKAEAERRIVAIMAPHQQRNVQAKGLEMVLKYGPDVTAWPPAEQARAQDALAKWAAIEAIRAASDVIEALDPIPQDYAADERWP